MKPKTCKHCGKEFTPLRPLQNVCSPLCASRYVKAQNKEKVAKEKAELKQRKEELKSRSDWAKEAQSAVNAYVRMRDHGLPCISCGRMHQGQIHGGHFLSRGAHPELALEEKNIHAQCAPCNTYLSGNQINYRKGLIDRFGVELVEWLEGPHEPKRYTVDDYKQIIATYKQKYRELAKAHGM